MILKTVRFQIVVRTLLILSLTFFAASLVLYRGVARRVRNDADALVSSKAQGVRDSIEAYWEAETDALEEDTAQEVAAAAPAKRHNLNFERIVARWLQENREDPLLERIDVRVFDAAGRRIAATSRFPATALLPVPAIPAAPDGGRFSNFAAAGPGGSTYRLRTYAVTEWERSDPAYLVEVVTSVASAEGALGHLRLVLFLLFPALIVASGLAGIVLARVTMEPVHRMADTVRRISAENLRLRVPPPPGRDELRSLADGFNRMLDRLEKAFADQRRFIEDLTHELKTPLAVLKGGMEVALKNPRDAAEYEEVLRSSLEEVDRIIRVSESLLTILRFENDRGTLALSPLDPAAIVAAVIEDVRGPAEGRGIALEFRPDPAPPVAGDALRLRQLFMNLLDNAVKYTPAGGRIDVAVGAGDGEAVVTVRNSGPGIPADELPRVFDRFYRGRADAATPGSGLGLPIARAIAALHDGRIEARSEPGRGAVFTVRLPAAAVPPPGGVRTV